MRIPHLFTLLLVALLASCAKGEPETRSEELARQVHDRQIEDFVDSVSERVAAHALSRAVEGAAAAGFGGDYVSLSVLGELPEPLQSLVQQILEDELHTPAFVQDGELNAQGQLLLEKILNAPNEGLWLERIDLVSLAAHANALADTTELHRLEDELALRPDEQSLLLQFMMGHSGLDGTLPATDAILQLITRVEDQNPVPRLAETVQAVQQILVDRSEGIAELEVLLTAAFLDYAYELRFKNLGYVPPALAQERGWNTEDQRQAQTIGFAMALDAYQDGRERGFEAVLAELPPPFEQYERLVRGVAEYREYVNTGGWEQLSIRIGLTVGDTGVDVVALRHRLAAERYYNGPLDGERFDEPLAQALRDYQSSHQLEVDGVVGADTLSSLNISAERRLAQIWAALEFWRTTARAQHAGVEHIWVNIPDFHAEFWEGRTLLRRWRVILGRGRGQPNSQGFVRGRTPIFSNQMRYLVFNPYWNVPWQIREEEYDHLIEEDPDWLVNNGYELVNEGGREWLRQLPGPANALGRVKFLFPNSHDVYMHDTPTKHLFARSTRSYSHGCIRVEDPLELANLMLRRDRGWTQERTQNFIDRQLEMSSEQWVSLITPIPIHIEYVSVRGGDDGRVEFLADPYRYDRPRVNAWEERLGLSSSE